MNEYEQIMQGLVSVHEATEKGFESVDARFAAQETRLDRVECQMRDGFAAHELRLSAVERQMRDGIAAHELQLSAVERQMRDGFADVNSRLDRIERNRGKRGGDRP